ANDIAETEETLEAETSVKSVELPEKVPVPVRKPRPEQRKAEEQALNKTKLARARGLEEAPFPILWWEMSSNSPTPLMQASPISSFSGPREFTAFLGLTPR